MSKTCIIVPTYNEAENITNLVEKLEQCLEDDFEIIIVDDNSPDGTAEIAQNLNQRYRNIVVYKRPGKKGIGSAVRNGMQIALSSPNCKYIVTMDADFSHNPNDVQRLLSEAKDKNIDLVQGSRYIKGGKIIGWGRYRKTQSYIANILCKLLLGLRTKEVTTYFRVYSRKCAEVVVKNVHSSKYDFAIASALVINDCNFRVKEIPITFIDRTRGKSKLKKSDVLVWFYVLMKTFFSRLFNKLDLRHFLRFCIVGASGVLVNEGLLWYLTEFFHLFYLYSAILSIETSIISNFVLNDVWTFRDRRCSSIGSFLERLLKYNTVCVTGLGLNVGILYALTEFFGFYYLISNLFGIAVVVLWNYNVNNKWTWGKVK
jgi:dolichol-phosphate mannosyltransferase